MGMDHHMLIYTTVEEQIVRILSKYFMHNILLNQKFDEVVRLRWINFHVPIWVFEPLFTVSVIYLWMFDEELSIKHRLWVGKFNPCQSFSAGIKANFRGSEVWYTSTHAYASPCHDAYFLKSLSLKSFSQIFETEWLS